MFMIAKRTTFSASHQLAGLGDDHPCARLHGHNYTVDIEVSGDLDGAGMVFDYGRLAPFYAWIAEHLDHRHLNDAMDENPTAEQLARHLYEMAVAVLDLPPGVRVLGIIVGETPRTRAEFRR